MGWHAERLIAPSPAAAQSLSVLKDQSAYQIYYSVLMRDKKSNVGLVASQLNRLKDPKQLAQIGIEEGIGLGPFGGTGYEADRQIRKHDDSPARGQRGAVLGG